MKTVQNSILCLILLCVFAIFSGCASTQEKSEFQKPINAEYLFAEQLGSGSAQVEPIRTTMSARKLKTIDLDQMNERILQYVSSYRETQDSSHLYRALVLTFSRPDEDSVRDKVLSILRAPIDENSAWQPFLQQLTVESIATLKSDSSSGEAQMTAGIILENVIQEILPDYRGQTATGGFESNLMYSIAVTPMKYSSAALQERKLALMTAMQTPDVIAKRIMTFNK